MVIKEGYEVRVVCPKCAGMSAGGSGSLDMKTGELEFDKYECSYCKGQGLVQAKTRPNKGVEPIKIVKIQRG